MEDRVGRSRLRGERLFELLPARVRAIREICPDVLAGAVSGAEERGRVSRRVDRHEIHDSSFQPHICRTTAVTCRNGKSHWELLSHAGDGTPSRSGPVLGGIRTDTKGRVPGWR